MPSNRYGGSGRYFNNSSSDGRNKSHQNPPPSHVAREPKKMDNIVKQESLPNKTLINIQNEPSGDKFKPIGDTNSGPDSQANKMPPHERKFTQRSRLFIGNLPPEMTEEEFKNMFKSFGEISETFVNADKGFGFVRLDTRANAEKAKWDLDGKNLKNRQLRVRFATHGAALSIKNLSPQVSNELLEEAFSQFGPVERAVVIVDDRGRSTERGIVEFARKSSATKALQQIRDGCFLLTSSPRAVVVSPSEQEDSEDGLPERNIQKGPGYFQEREAPPRFAQSGTFEEEFARRWKALDDLEKHQREQLDKSIQAAKEKLELEMENAIHEHRNMLMKQDLIRRQEELQRLEEARKRELDRRQQLELAREEARKKEMEEMQHRQELLRAQIEGSYKPEGNLGFRGNLSRQGFSGRPGSPPSQSMLHEALAQEMMGGHSQGGLGPAPKKKTSQNVCHYTLRNMERLMGSQITNDLDIFYRLAFQNCPTNVCFCGEQSKDAVLSKDSLYTNLQPCSNFILCQSFNLWKSSYKMNQLNRFFDGVQLSTDFLTLYFLPLGPFPAFVQNFKSCGLNLFQLLSEFLKVFFSGCKIHILPECNIDEFSFTQRRHFLTGKQQYLVQDIFPVLKTLLPKDGFCIVALSWNDLYPCEDLNFVLGQGSFQHHSCISSFGRFDPTYIKGFKGNKTGVSVEELEDIKCVDVDLLWKLLKVTVHETCHVFGLSHCVTFSCLMNESKSSEEALNQPIVLCPLCMKKIQYACSHWPKRKGLFNVKTHLASILQFLSVVLMPMIPTPKETTGNSNKFCVKTKLISTMEWIKKTLNILDSSNHLTSTS